MNTHTKNAKVTKVQYTPGPWKYYTNTGGQSIHGVPLGPTNALIVEEDGTTIVELSVNVRSSRLEANARLIAQAPAMIRILRELTVVPEECGPWIKELMAQAEQILRQVEG